MLIEASLPSWERANILCDAYFCNLSWLYRPVHRSQIVEILSVVHKRGGERHRDSRVDIHDLAVLLAVLALGATADLSQSPYNVEAESLLQLARMALGLKDVFEDTSVSTVQAVALLSAYDLHSWRTTNADSAWKVNSLALVLALSVCLYTF